MKWIQWTGTSLSITASSIKTHLLISPWPEQSADNDISSSVDKSVQQENETSRKRARSDSCSRPGTKACREKLRRERLNDRFLDLSCILEPGRPARTDKPAILEDAIRVLNQLRT
ncbi:Transcription factor protein [Melia azedarach]|uniref:Transcription factor protein n=1 Tax=Melia azedarach TaxID=155640 RepID=A0ACC1YGQ1_MELAZ|nr:Transcription factor protein [Melia azedarach]